jgi:hypothetical protein
MGQRSSELSGVSGISSHAQATTAEWMGASLSAALAIVLIIYLGAGHGEKLGLALRATARWSFLWFWLASVGSALATLFGARFQPLAQRGRDFGLAFASAHLAHLGLVAWLLYHLSTPFPRSPLIFFSIGVFWIYLLALLSIRRLSATLAPSIWRIVRTLGVEYISFAFLVDFAKNPFQGGVPNLLAYLPFLALAVAGPLLRLAAVAKRLSQARDLVSCPINNFTEALEFGED